MYNSWFNDFDIDVNDLEVQVKAAKNGCEFVVDAGWYGTGTDWFNYAGVGKSEHLFYGRNSLIMSAVKAGIGCGWSLWVCENACV